VCGPDLDSVPGGDCIGAMAAPTEDELEDFIKELELQQVIGKMFDVL